MSRMLDAIDEATRKANEAVDDAQDTAILAAVIILAAGLAFGLLLLAAARAAFGRNSAAEWAVAGIGILVLVGGNLALVWWHRRRCRRIRQDHADRLKAIREAKP